MAMLGLMSKHRIPPSVGIRVQGWGLRGDCSGYPRGELAAAARPYRTVHMVHHAGLSTVLVKQLHVQSSIVTFQDVDDMLSKVQFNVLR